ncbi:ssDNA-binding protein, mitochondrial [Onygenales sp. PD_40]|nr:ssDNA-binding protein, mitochondrial [Onygenales sp. PD_40]KAK2782908.1 ssDNA-binding protein, mitochondrial [Onygenales sp. PD_12]KAK2803715.1 ssDNA-binding protein, mitochondrial [Onygenales sp. PD_10]
MRGLTTFTPLFRAPASSLTRSFSTTPSRAFARITIAGNLGAQPELRATSTGREVVSYSIATSHGHKDDRQTSWWRVTNFAPEGPARDLLLSLPKGTLLLVEGDANMRSYEDAEGKKNSILNITQRHFEVLRRSQSAEHHGAEGSS